MLQLDLRSKKSIHEQIVDGIKALIIKGEFKANDKLPSVRDLSSQLTVNPNTIAKAFRTLESQGWIYTVSGRGCFVSEGKQGLDTVQVKRLFAQIDAAALELLFMGITEDEILEKVNEMLKKGVGSND